MLLIRHLIAAFGASALILISATLLLWPNAVRGDVTELQSSRPSAQSPALKADTSVFYRISYKTPWRDVLLSYPKLLRLASCEAGDDTGRVEFINPMARNDNDAKITGQSSYGIFQYQPNTFLNAVKMYGLMGEATDKEIIAAINDPWIQISVTQRLLRDGGGGAWYHCWVARGLKY